MSMSTTRSLRNRSSRYSSPATFAENQAPSRPVQTQKSSNGGQTSPEQWVEPTVRNPVPSFEDTKGLERVGVLEHLQPLGMPPSQKLLQKLKVNLSRASPRVTPVNAEDTTPPVESSRVDGASPVNTEPLSEAVRLDEAIVLSSPPRGRPAKKEVEEMRQQVIDLSTPQSSPIKSTMTPVHTSPRPQSIQDYIRQDRMKSVIDRAIAEADDLRSDRKLVPGLQQLWEDAKDKPQLWLVLDAILDRTPSEAQFKTFKRYIKRGVRRYNRESTAPLPLSINRQPLSPRTQDRLWVEAFCTPLTPVQDKESKSHRSESPYRLSSLNIRHQMSPANQRAMSSQSRRANSATETDTQISPRRKRSRSESNSSSLSSAKSLPEDYSPETIEIDAESQATEGQPVESTGQRQATKRVAVGSRTRSSIVPQPEPSQPSTGAPTTIKFVSKRAKLSGKKDDHLYDPERIAARRSEIEQTSFRDYNNISRPESHERTLVRGFSTTGDSLNRVPPPVIHPYSLVPSTAILSSPTEAQAKPELPLTNGTSRKRQYDEIDKEDIDATTPLSSSPAPLFAPPEPGLASVTRGTTPRGARLPPPNKARKSARVMVSPNKPKNGGITAGISRAGPGRDTAIGNSAESGAEDNDEFCASCGGEGILLCCDGCTNSFHHGCLEPPLNPDDVVEGEWFCPRCVARRNKDYLPATGLMGQIIRRVDHTIPKAYTLPAQIRDYFEGVKTGDEGEYEEVGLPRTQNTGAKMNRAGFFEEPSYKELRDNKGNFIVCHRCQKTSGGRDIIPCDYCPAKWHMDCLDPPLAVPPRRRGGDKPTGYWRCPLHIDSDLAEIGRQPEAAPGDLGRFPRPRKPKKAIPIDIDLLRGFRNNGVIEVELMKDEMPEIKDVTLDGGIYRLPEKGIRLDFIDRVKKSWYEDQVFPRQFNAPPRIRNRLYRPDDPVVHHPAAYTVVKHKEPDFFRGATAMSVAETARTNARLRHRSFKEQSAVMSLVGLSQQPRNGYSIDPLADLTNVLIAEAPGNVEIAIDLSEKELLVRLQRLINGRLAVLANKDKGKSATLGKGAVPEPGLLNGDITEQLNGDADGYGDDEGDGGSGMEINF